MRMMKRSIGTLCLVLICAGPPALCAQELSGGVSAMTEASSFGIGMIGLINTTSPWPVFPMLVYRHRFDKRWSMEIMPPPKACLYSKKPYAAGIEIE